MVRIIDDTAPFEKAIVNNHHLGKKKLAAVVEREYLNRRRSIYSLLSPVSLDTSFIEKYLGIIDVRRGRVRYYGKEIDRSAFARDIANFNSRFALPDGLEIHIVPSFFVLQGMSVPSGKQTKVYVGLDDVQRWDEPQRQCLIYHELGHVVHYEAVPEVRQSAAEFFSGGKATDAMYIALWVEGLPTYLARLVNPDIPKANILNFGTSIQQTLTAYEKTLTLLESRLDTTDISGFFYFPDNRHPDIPLNCGYFLGLLVVEEVAKNHSPEELVTLWGPGLRSEIHKAVAQLQKKSGLPMGTIR
jgi:hypothetical protein